MRNKLLAAALVGGTALYARDRGRKRLGVPYQEARRRVVIVGGGFGGISAFRQLVDSFTGSDEIGVLLLDRVNYTTFWPMVPSAISGNVEVRHMAYPLRRLVIPRGGEFFQGEVVGVDFERKKIRTEFGECDYDHLILAPGSQTAFFGTKGAKEHAIDLKGLREALEVRGRIIDRFEEAERLRGKVPEEHLTFVFVGGGPTGVEGISDAHDLIFDVLKDDYPSVDFDRVRLVLVNAGERILKGIDPSLANAASRRLAAQRVEVINNTKVDEVSPEYVRLSDGRTLPTRTTVWAAGIQPPPLVEGLDIEKDGRGRIIVDEYLRVKNRPGVYAVGDCVTIDYDGPPVPALAQSAEQEGRTAALNLAAELKGGELTPFRYRHLGQLVDLGESSALTDILGVRVSGLLGALIWKGVYLYELGYNLNRAQVLFDWTVDLFTRPNISKLFVD
ncbi:NAD(P)/FAD-dependent oxidoreductase [Rubrobacter calidifluminis]|uniref:NAD(P)/FAD-dependent oxidoreductase n=1 Tax=Rubrobacter calidifluminis TaxID=1392640 RepID=UPI0023610CA3|nr:NAD(P)/FAD-dependent oxidoreductase [Rubrobacter calidifluminis]